MSIEYERLSPALGAHVAGLDLSASSEDLVSVLRKLLHQVGVVVIADQDMSEQELMQFGLRWGNLLTHPASEKRSNPYVQVLASTSSVRGRGLGSWHSDMSWHPTPPWITMLHAKKVPSFGGDTGYANQRLALEMLDLAKRDTRRSHRRHLPSRDEVESLCANHTGKGFGEHVPDSVHPVIRTHDSTDSQALYVNPEFTTHIVDVDGETSERILWPLWLHCTSEEFVYRHRWKAGDLVMWDNRLVMHTSILDYDEPRTMLRVVVEGDVPA